jgi:predicted ATPase
MPPESSPVSERFRVRLPVEPNPLIGRSDDVSRVDAQLEQGRVVTLVGPPGIGKTRLALRLVHRAGSRGWFCDVLEATDRSGFCAAVAKGLGVPAGAKPVATLGRRLAALGTALVVVDNVEQVVEDAVAALDLWLEMAPRVRFLVTSRERLRIKAERVVELAPLALPADGELDARACELFVERVRAARGDYQPEDAERRQIAELVVALDGIPLAIELAAGRFDVLGVAGLLERVGRPLDVLSHGARDADRRQSTLRGAIDASWQLLTDGERGALAQLSLFRGGFAADAAEALIGAEALDRLQSLRDRSLLLVPEPGRFSLYASIRAFAAEKLAELGGHDEAAARLRDHYLERGEVELRRFAESGAGLERVGSERDNLLAVFERAVRADQPEHAARAVLVLAPLLLTRGPARRLAGMLERALAIHGDDPRLLHARGRVRRVLGDLDGAEADLVAALELEPEGALYVAIRKDLGVTYQLRRHIDAARACYEAALPRAIEIGDRRAEGSLISNLGALDHDIGRFESAAARYAKGLDRLREVGDARLEGITLANLGVLEHEQGRNDAAHTRYVRALELLRESGDFRFEAITLGNLGVLEHEAGDLEGARARHEAALDLLVEVGDVHSEALARARLGAVLADQSALEEARRELDEAERRVVGRDAVALELVRLHRAFVDFAEQDEEAASARITAAQAPRAGDGPSLAAINDDARLVLRILGRRFAERAGPHLVIGPEGCWFRVPGGEPQSLDRFTSARRILHHLADARLTNPGRGVPGDVLFDAGWPDVAIAAQSANNRLYVALAKLRKLGLKVLLLRNDDGYYLDPSVPLERSTEREKA